MAAKWREDRLDAVYSTDGGGARQRESKERASVQAGRDVPTGTGRDDGANAAAAVDAG